MKLKTLTLVLLAALTNVLMAQQGDIVGKIENTKATVVEVAGKCMLVPVDKTNQRYAPRNMADKFCKEGLKVIVSGNILKAPPGVRMAGTPLQITDIKVDNNKALQATADAGKSDKPKIVRQINKVEGRIMAKANTFVFIPKKDENTHYVPQNLDKSFQKENMNVVVSGDVLEAPKGVRLVGTPLRITDIKVIKGTKAEAGATNAGTKAEQLANSKSQTKPKAVKDLKGVVQAKANTFIIAVGNTHYAPGKSLPANYKKDGAKIIFSGTLGEIPQGAKVVGTPITITKINVDRPGGSSSSSSSSTRPAAKPVPNQPKATEKKAARSWWKFW